MNNSYEQEFYEITKDILENNDFSELDNEIHHGITRFGHSYRVSKGLFYVSKFLHFKSYKEATRAALLHDFYFDYQLENNEVSKNFKLHPSYALLNATSYYELNDMQKNMIVSHMFPVGNNLPKYKESICLTIVDKVVALYEMQRFKIAMKIGVYLLFAINMLTLEK